VTTKPESRAISVDELASSKLADTARALPVLAAVTTSTAVLTWQERGSINATHWLPVAVLVALLLLVVLAAGAARRPHRLSLAGLAATVALGGLAMVSLEWSPLPTLARDEGLLTLAYATALALPLLVLRGGRDGALALAAVAAAPAALALVTAAELARSSDPESLYRFERLSFPVSYANAIAAVFLIGVWPALSLAASRAVPVPARALALAAGTASAAGWLLTQSKGGALGLCVSAAVVLVVVPGRLRLLVPTALVGGLSAAGFLRLTGPYRLSDDATAIADAGRALLVLTAIGFVLGLVYATADRRIRTNRKLERAAGLAVGLLALAGVAAALAAVGRPDQAAAAAWDEFKSGYTRQNTASTHLLSLGSNRYDMWRVTLAEFEEEPVVGVGARGFGALYLREGRTEETPARAHSVLLEVLVEQGVVGLLLLLVGVGTPLALVVGHARQRALPAVAALGGCCGWLAHASVDWIWTFPAAGVPFFCLLGIGAASPGRPPLSRAASAGGALAAALALALFVPALLAGRLTERALTTPVTAERDLRWARTLDPVSVEPLVAEGRVAEEGKALAALAKAARKEPRSVRVRYLYGLRLLDAGRAAAATRELEAARLLSPNDLLIEATLRRARAIG